MVLGERKNTLDFFCQKVRQLHLQQPQFFLFGATESGILKFLTADDIFQSIGSSKTIARGDCCVAVSCGIDGTRIFNEIVVNGSCRARINAFGS